MRLSHPFLIQVMEYSCEAGYKFEVSVAKAVSGVTTIDPPKTKRRLLFELYRKNDSGGFDDIVHVSYTADNTVREEKIAVMTSKGVNSAQAKQLITKVYPAVRAIEQFDSLKPSEQEKRKRKIMTALSKTVDLA